MKRINMLLLCATFAFVQSCAQKPSTEEVAVVEKQVKPNVIYVLADDMGYGDLGCYGQQYIETPNIDAMADKGMKLNYHYSGSTVCAPSRSSLMTGLHTGHSPIRGNKELFPEGQEAMPDTLMTVAKFFKSQGYATAAFGKWGLGYVGTTGDPVNQGFDEFYGYNCQRQAHRYYPDHLWHNQTKVSFEGNLNGVTAQYVQDSIHNKALDFVTAHKDESFYIYLPYVAPHAETIAPDDSLLSYYAEKFKDMPGTPYVAKPGGDYGPDMDISKYCSQDKPRVHFAAMIHRLDVYMGELNAHLESLGIADNTLVIFTSDNGAHREGGADPKFFNSSGGLRGYKRDLYEGGVRVPFIAYWPGTIKAGVSDHQSTFWDMNVTYADMIGVEYAAKTDGVSFWPTLMGDKVQKKHDYLYWEFHEGGGKQAVIKDNVKLVKLKANKPDKTKFEMFDLVADPQEQNNIYGSNAELASSLEDLMKESHVANPMFPFMSEKGTDEVKPFYVD